jgi:hypothetical protein
MKIPNVVLTVCLPFLILSNEVQGQDIYYGSGGFPKKYTLFSINDDVIVLESYFKWQGQFLILKKDTIQLHLFNETKKINNVEFRVLKNGKINLKIQNTRIGNLSLTLTKIHTIPDEFLKIRECIDD